MRSLVAIVMGSASDLDTVQESASVLKEFNIPFEIKVLSAHRTPKELAAYVEAAPGRGIRVFIAAAGGAAALAGVIAAHSILPVIGIPIETKSLKGLDSLLSTVQMPAGVPVAGMSIGKAGARNAGLLAAQIIGITDKRVGSQMCAYRKAMRGKIKKTRLKIKK